MLGLISPYTRIFRTPTESVDSKSHVSHAERRTRMFGAALARAHVYAAHHSNYGGSSQHGGAFPHRGLRRRAAPRARPRGARLAQRLLRRRGTCLSAFPPFPSRDRRIASAHARRARGGTPSDRRERARGTARVRRRCSASRRVPRDGARAPEEPARRAHRPRASPFRVRVWVHSARRRDVEDKMRPAPEGP